jgi:hypothetical protein
VALALFFLLEVFYDLTVGALVEYFYPEVSRRVFGIFCIIMG